MHLKRTKPVPLPRLCIWLFPQVLCPQILVGTTQYLLQFRFQLKGHLFREASVTTNWIQSHFPAAHQLFPSEEVRQLLPHCSHVYTSLVSAHLSTTSPKTQKSVTKEHSDSFQGLNEWMNEWFRDRLPTMWPRAKHLTSQGSNFLVHKMSGLDCSSSKIPRSFVKQYNILQSFLLSHSKLTRCSTN